jgi:hypothetical protein
MRQYTVLVAAVLGQWLLSLSASEACVCCASRLWQEHGFRGPELTGVAAAAGCLAAVQDAVCICTAMDGQRKRGLCGKQADTPE